MNIKYKDGTNFLCPECEKDEFNPGINCIGCISCGSIISNEHVAILAEKNGTTS